MPERNHFFGLTYAVQVVSGLIETLVKKANMNVSGNVGQTGEANVVPLFAKIQIETETSQLLPETMTEWDLEIDSEEEAVIVARNLVTENHFPDQSLYILNDQVSKLRESIERLKFYLNDVDDLLPRKI